jgi:hypothetical protein
MSRQSVILIGALALALGGCVVDGLLFTQTLDEEHETPPEPSPTVLRGALDPDRSGELLFWDASGGRVTPRQTRVTEEGFYEASFAGTDSFSGLRLTTTRGSQVSFGLVPNIPRARSVRSPTIRIDLADDLPPMARISDETTAITLAVERKSQGSGGLGSLAPDQLTEVIGALGQEVFAEGPLLTLRQMITRLQDAAAAAPAGTPTVFALPDQRAPGSSPLSADFLLRVGVDYDNDGANDRDTASFDAALDAVANSVDLNSCLSEESVRLVLQLDINEGAQDLNCEVIDRFQWIEPDPGDGVFLTGAVHVDQPNCAESPGEAFCLDEAEIAATSKLLGDFVPNQVAMYDDGTNGDAVAGDGIWTLALEVPRGVRLGYKYTYGKGGEGWTGTEEWPGNSRIIQAEDTDGDGIVVRRDLFGDESSNKDKQNALSPSRGGRGVISFDTDANGDGVIEARENRIDTDGDCVADAAPSPGPVSPVFCEE